VSHSQCVHRLSVVLHDGRVFSEPHSRFPGLEKRPPRQDNGASVECLDRAGSTLAHPIQVPPCSIHAVMVLVHVWSQPVWGLSCHNLRVRSETTTQSMNPSAMAHLPRPPLTILLLRPAAFPTCCFPLTTSDGRPVTASLYCSPQVRLVLRAVCCVVLSLRTRLAARGREETAVWHNHDD
jgi:hypothetical protein